MHGVKRVKQPTQALDAKKLLEHAKLAEYLALIEDVISRKKSRDWSHEALQLTSRLLQINPEFYTVWNYRRNIFIHGIFPDSTLEEIHNILSNDLSTTMAALKAHPKVYWIWNHRRWCLENIPSGPTSDDGSDTGARKKTAWDKELFVVEKMLDADPRNFHAWDYRRYVLASMPAPRPKKSELAYTARKIETNISNFSAWHQRSKIITSLWEDGQLPLGKSTQEEFELLRNAMYTDPNDQSVWMYHRWLVGSGPDKELLESEIAVIQELLDEQPDSKWCMESIVHYKRLLLRNHLEHVDTKKLSADCQELLKQLQKMDPSRRRRYEGIEQAMTG